NSNYIYLFPRVNTSNYSLQAFQNVTFGELTLLKIDDKEFFPASECASMLGYSNAAAAIRRHCKYSFKHNITISSKNFPVNFIPESDLFRLIVKSKLPYAEKFEKWVFEEILPSIIARGIYATAKVVQEGLNDPTTIQNLLNELKVKNEESNKLIAVNESLLLAIDNNKEKVHYHDVILNNDSLIPITAIAKEYGLSSIQMNKILFALKVQYKISDRWFLYQNYATFGYTYPRVVDVNAQKPISITHWTEKGRAFIIIF
ncbi:MAG: phage antirepressor, partial [Clostridium sp.]